jgi:hypothetical protein
VFGTAFFWMYCSTAEGPGRGCSGIFDAVGLAQGAAAGEHEFADVIAVGGHVVVAQEGQPVAAAGKFGAEAGAVIAGRAAPSILGTALPGPATASQSD